MIDFIKAAEEAHRIFTAEGWEWASRDGYPAGVPAKWQLELELRRLADQVRREGVVKVMTGRLYAERDPELGTVEIGIEHTLGFEQ